MQFASLSMPDKVLCTNTNNSWEAGIVILAISPALCEVFMGTMSDLVTFHVLTIEARQCSDLMLGMFELDIVIGSAEKAELLKLF